MRPIRHSPPSTKRSAPACGASSTREITPHVDAWDEAGTSRASCTARPPPSACIGIGYPEALGGTPADRVLRHRRPPRRSRAPAAAACRPAWARTASRCRRSSRTAATRSSAAWCRRCSPARRSPRCASPSRRRLRRGGAQDQRACATATTMWSTARRPSSPRACAPTFSPWRCAPTRPTRARAASRCW